MRSMTLEQLCAAQCRGRGRRHAERAGGTFLVQITTGSGANAVLAKARSSQPRRFGNPAVALNVLRDLGITTGQFDASERNPVEKEPTPGTSGVRQHCARRTRPLPIPGGWRLRFGRPSTILGRISRTVKSWQRWTRILPLLQSLPRGSAHEERHITADDGRIGSCSGQFGQAEKCHFAADMMAVLAVIARMNNCPDSLGYEADFKAIAGAWGPALTA